MPQDKDKLIKKIPLQIVLIVQPIVLFADMEVMIYYKKKQLQQQQ